MAWKTNIRLLGGREFGKVRDTLLCLTWRTCKDLLSSPGKSAQYSVIT